jgi:hypothetical protein
LLLQILAVLLVRYLTHLARSGLCGGPRGEMVTSLNALEQWCNRYDVAPEAGYRMLVVGVVAVAGAVGSVGVVAVAGVVVAAGVVGSVGAVVAVVTAGVVTGGLRGGSA